MARNVCSNCKCASSLFDSLFSGSLTGAIFADAKNYGPEFWNSNSNSVIFENFLKFSKMHRAVPLQPIWTIMVAAKLDHSRVLVTKFHQNQSTLKGRSASQRQTHRQTNSAENNGSSGLQSGQNIIEKSNIGYRHTTASVPCLESVYKERIMLVCDFQCFEFPSVLWHCCLVDRKVCRWSMKNLL